MSISALVSIPITRQLEPVVPAAALRVDADGRHELLSEDTIKNLVKHRFFQTDHILGTIIDDLENFFLMPAPLNNRFDFQTRQNFKKKYTGSAWASVRLFVKQALALQRKFGRY